MQLKENTCTVQEEVKEAAAVFWAINDEECLSEPEYPDTVSKKVHEVHKALAFAAHMVCFICLYLNSVYMYPLLYYTQAKVTTVDDNSTGFNPFVPDSQKEEELAKSQDNTSTVVDESDTDWLAGAGL